MINFSRGFLDYISAIGKIGHYRLWIYVTITALASLGLGFAVFGSIFRWGDDLGNYLISQYPFEWSGKIIRGLIDWLSRILLWSITFFIFKYIVLIIMSPLMSLISSKIEKQITGRSTSRFTLIGELARGIQFNLRILFKELVYIILLLIFSFVPVVGLLSAALIFLTQSYFAGLGVMDYYLERHYSVKESLKVGNQNRVYLTGLGSGFMLTMLIPFVGTMFAPILGTIATTEYACKDKMVFV